MHKVPLIYTNLFNLFIALFNHVAREPGEPLTDQNVEPYPYKQRAQLGALGSCSQLFLLHLYKKLYDRAAGYPEISPTNGCMVYGASWCMMHGGKVCLLRLSHQIW